MTSWGRQALLLLQNSSAQRARHGVDIGRQTAATLLRRAEEAGIDRLICHCALEHEARDTAAWVQAHGTDAHVEVLPAWGHLGLPMDLAHTPRHELAQQTLPALFQWSDDAFRESQLAYTVLRYTPRYLLDFVGGGEDARVFFADPAMRQTAAQNVLWVRVLQRAFAQTHPQVYLHHPGDTTPPFKPQMTSSDLLRIEAAAGFQGLLQYLSAVSEGVPIVRCTARDVDAEAVVNRLLE